MNCVGRCLGSSVINSKELIEDFKQLFYVMENPYSMLFINRKRFIYIAHLDICKCVFRHWI